MCGGARKGMSSGLFVTYSLIATVNFRRFVCARVDDLIE